MTLRGTERLSQQAVGFLKRKARQLLTGNRLSSNWWGVAVLASAHYSRCAAGFEAWPTGPFGVRAMVVQDPKSKNAFVPRSLPATVFGPSQSVPGGYIVFQAGRLKEVVNLVASDLGPEELTNVKAHFENWEDPHGSTILPSAATWDATVVEEPRPEQLGEVSVFMPEEPQEQPTFEEARDEPLATIDELVSVEEGDLPHIASKVDCVFSKDSTSGGD